MNKPLLIAVLAACATLNTAPCFAADATHEVKKPIVTQGVGISSTLAQIDQALKNAAATGKLTHTELTEYTKRAHEIRASLDADKAGGNLSFTEMQRLAKEAYNLGESLNNALAPEAVAPPISYQQIKLGFDDLIKRIRNGQNEDKLHAVEAHRFRKEALRILQLAESNQSDPEKLAVANSDLTRLSVKVDRFLAATLVNVRTANSFLMMPRSF